MKKKSRNYPKNPGYAYGLSYKQRKAIQYLIAFDKNLEETINMLGIHPKTMKRWFAQEKFIAYLEERLQAVELVDAKYRAKRNKQIVGAVYKEIIKRIAEGKLQKMSLQQLISAAKVFSHEIRVDTPGDVTSKSKVEHHVLDELASRYEDSKASSPPKLSLVEPPSRKGKKKKKEKKHANEG
jgi:hypothetical protein